MKLSLYFYSLVCLLYFKTINRFVLLICLLFGPALMSGLVGCEEKCGGAYQLQTRDYQVSLRWVDPQKPNTYLPAHLSSGETVNYKEIELHLTAEVQRVAIHQVTTGANLWACDPSIIPLDRIKELTVSSNQAYNASLPAGSDLKTVLSTGLYGSNHRPLTEALSDLSPEGQSIGSLRFTQAPDRSAQHEFTIRIELSRGPVFTLRTKPVTVTP
jgi:hypothetical protein